MNIIFFTNTYPYGTGETFIESELEILAKSLKSTIHIFPLQVRPNEQARAIPENVVLHTPFLDFSTKDKSKLLLKGMLNLVPFGFSLKEFNLKNVSSQSVHFKKFCTSLLLYRAMKNSTTAKELLNTVKNDDILYFYWGDKSVNMLRWLKKSLNCKAFVRFHRSDLYEYANSGYIPFRQTMLPYIDYLLPISDDGARYLRKSYTDEIANKQIEVARLGVKDMGLNPTRDIEGQYHIVTCSNAVAVKRLNLVVMALANVRLAVKWTHIGDGKMLKSVKKAAENLLGKNVEVNFMGQKTNREIMEYYQQVPIDLFLNVSSSEGIPVSIMEAFSFGIPAMATDVGGTSEIVDRECGILLSKSITTEKLTQEIERFFQKNQKTLRSNARKKWEKLYNAEKNYSALAQIFAQQDSSSQKLD